MRIYIIGNDGITLCRAAPAAVNEGEIAVASNEELHTASLSGRRLHVSPRARFCAPSTDTTGPLSNTKPSFRSTATGPMRIRIWAGASL